MVPTKERQANALADAVARLRSRVDSDQRARFVFYLVIWLAGLGALQFIWPTPQGVIVQGVILGSLSALVAFGLSLIYRANRVINFAQADLGVTPAAVGVALISARGWPYAVALPFIILIAIALGALSGLLVQWRFAKAPRLILSVATIGLAQVLIFLGFVLASVAGGSGTNILSSLGNRFAPPFDFTFKVSPIVFTANDLLAIVIMPVMVIGLVGFLNKTTLGTAVRASAQSSDRASLVGINVGLTNVLVWVLASVLSAVAMILRAGIFGLPLGEALGPSILLRALAAAVIGRMENYTLMFLGATFIGIVETAIIWNEDTSTLIAPALFVFVIGVLLFQRRRARTRVDEQATSSWQDISAAKKIPSELAKLPEVDWAIWALKVLGIGFLIALPFLLGDADINLAGAVIIFAIIAVSMVVLTGWGGEISLGQMAFVAIGSATAGVVNTHYQWDVTVTLLAAGAVGAIASLVIGLPALRIRGLFLAVTTLAFALATSSFLLNRTYFPFLPDNVSQRIVRLPVLGRLDISSERAFYFVCVAVFLAALWSVTQLQRSRTARVLMAVRDNEANAQAYGIDLTRVKLLAFSVSGFYASMAGGLFALHQQAIGQEVFAPAQSIRVLTMVVIGGLGSIPGAISGAVFLKGTEYFSDFVPRDIRAFWTFASSGAGLLGVLMFLRGGLGQLYYGLRDSVLRLVALRRGIIVPSLFADARVEQHLDAGEDAEAAARFIIAARQPRPGATGIFKYVPVKPAPDVDYFSFPDIVTAEEASPSLLSIRSLDVAYGPVQVLFGVNLELHEGEIIALLGTNGAGKSTVLRAISGLAMPGGGSVSFDGAEVTTMAPHRIAKAGIAQVPGGKGVFPALSVAENLALGGWLFRKEHRRIDEATARVLELFPILREKLDDTAASLSGGQQQMLTLAMALMAKPKLLLIDELSLGLAPVVVEELLQVVRRLNAEGVTIVIVEQSVNIALTIADTAYFMEKGEIRFHGPTSDLLERDDILRSVFLEGAGKHMGEAAARTRERAEKSFEHAPVKLEVVDLSKSFFGNRAVNEVSLSLHEGEILGIIGPNGAGKTTVFDLISGLQMPDSGRVLLEGQDVTELPPHKRAWLGLSRSFQDSRLFGSLSVEDVIKLSLDNLVAVRDPVAAALALPDVGDSERELRRRADELIELMGLGAFRNKFVSELSTGSRRIVDLACQIALRPKVILFDEPSSGIAQRETEALGPLLQQIRAETGASLLVIEHDMPMLTALSDRMIALDLGVKVAEGSPQDVLNDPVVVASYLGTSRDVIERSGLRPPAAPVDRRAMRRQRREVAARGGVAVDDESLEPVT